MIPYYIQLLPYSGHKKGKSTFDKNGVIMSKIRYNKHYNYHATAIASYAIINLPSEQAYENINWLKNNHEKGAIYHDFDIVSYDNVRAPWIGSLAQSLSISALCLAYKHDKDKDNLLTAHKFMGALEKHCIQRNLLGTWFCEYPNIYSILNGHIYSMFCLQDIIKYTTSPETKQRAQSLWKETEHTVLNNLYRYNLGNWSRYDLHTLVPAKEFYHKVHISQLQYLNFMGGSPLYDKLITDWIKGLNKIHHYKFKAMWMHMKRHGLIESMKRLKQTLEWKYL